MKRKALPKAKPSIATVKTEELIDQIAEGLPLDPTTDLLVEMAKYIYTSSMKKVSIAQIVNHPGFKGQVARITLERYAIEEQWGELRRKNAEEWRKDFTRQTGRELIEVRKKMLAETRQVLQHIFKKLLPKKGADVPEIHSYEGLVQAWVKVIDRYETLTQSVLDEVMPDIRPAEIQDVATSQTKHAIQPSSTPEEWKIGVNAILEHRRRVQAQLTGTPLDEDDDEEE